MEELKGLPVFQEIQSSRLTGILDGSLLDLLSFDWLSATKPKSGEVPQLRVSKMIAIDFHDEADVAYVVSSSIDGKSWSYVCEVLRRVSGDVGQVYVSEGRANGYALYEMAGNVFEWYWDLLIAGIAMQVPRASLTQS